jgi:hypothetical protein
MMMLTSRVRVTLEEMGACPSDESRVESVVACKRIFTAKTVSAKHRSKFAAQ